jgi:hypothetical protein
MSEDEKNKLLGNQVLHQDPMSQAIWLKNRIAIMKDAVTIQETIVRSTQDNLLRNFGTTNKSNIDELNERFNKVNNKLCVLKELKSELEFLYRNQLNEVITNA